MSEKPKIEIIENFLSPDDCSQIIELAKPRLSRSTVVDDDKSFGQKVDDRRTSFGMFFSHRPQEEVLQKLEDQIEKLTNFPKENGESFQILHYLKGGEYQPHFDYFSSKTEGGRSHLNRGGQRAVTVIVYLNTPEKGGETIFPSVNIRIEPKIGNALLFHNCLPNQEEDPLSFHGGAPVLEGEKWILTRWIRYGAFR